MEIFWGIICSVDTKISSRSGLPDCLGLSNYISVVTVEIESQSEGNILCMIPKKYVKLTFVYSR